MKFCIATEATYEQTPWREDAWLCDALTALGCRVDVRDWQHAADWLSYDAIFVSSTWNIPSAPEAFVTWLQQCEADGKARLINDAQTLLLGVAKDRYWHVLETSGDPELQAALTPTAFVLSSDPNRAQALTDAMQQCAAPKQVFKPIVSADSLHTFVFDPSASALIHDSQYRVSDPQDRDARIAAIFADPGLRGVMVQPYLDGIETGEMSATFVGRRLVGAVKKIPGFGPAPSKTRVEVKDDAMLAQLGALGGRVLAAIELAAVAPVRSRLDVIPEPQGLRLLEAEMVDPNCNFSTLGDATRDAAVGALAKALVAAARGMQTARDAAPETTS